jgi:hypothetical protein
MRGGTTSSELSWAYTRRGRLLCCVLAEASFEGFKVIESFGTFTNLRVPDCAAAHAMQVCGAAAWVGCDSCSPWHPAGQARRTQPPAPPCRQPWRGCCPLMALPLPHSR